LHLVLCFVAMLLLVSTTCQQVSAECTGAAAITRGYEWVNAKLQYCQAIYGAPDADNKCASTCKRQSNPQWNPYRSDCSGFVSWSYQLAAPGLSTRGFAPYGSTVSSEITIAELQPGDCINSVPEEHIMMFVKWTKDDKTEALFIEEPSCSGSKPYAKETTSAVTTVGKLLHLEWNKMSFQPIRITGGKCSGDASAATPATPAAPTTPAATPTGPSPSSSDSSSDSSAPKNTPECQAQGAGSSCVDPGSACKGTIAHNKCGAHDPFVCCVPSPAAPSTPNVQDIHIPEAPCTGPTDPGPCWVSPPTPTSAGVSRDPGSFVSLHSRAQHKSMIRLPASSVEFPHCIDKKGQKHCGTLRTPKDHPIAKAHRAKQAAKKKTTKKKTEKKKPEKKKAAKKTEKKPTKKAAKKPQKVAPKKNSAKKATKAAPKKKTAPKKATKKNSAKKTKKAEPKKKAEKKAKKTEKKAKKPAKKVAKKVTKKAPTKHAAAKKKAAPKKAKTAAKKETKKNPAVKKQAKKEPKKKAAVKKTEKKQTPKKPIDKKKKTVTKKPLHPIEPVH